MLLKNTDETTIKVIHKFKVYVNKPLVCSHLKLRYTVLQFSCCISIINALERFYTMEELFSRNSSEGAKRTLAEIHNAIFDRVVEGIRNYYGKPEVGGLGKPLPWAENKNTAVSGPENNRFPSSKISRYIGLPIK